MNTILAIHVNYMDNDVSDMPGLLLSCIVVALLLWLWSVVVIARNKTEDPYDRIVWLIVVLALNFVGTLLYFFFAQDSPKPGSEEEIKRRANEGTL